MRSRYFSTGCHGGKHWEPSRHDPVVRYALMSPSLGKLKFAFRAVLITLAFLQAWAGRFFIEPDGVNYLDVADAYLRRDWSHALNGYWSPLYSWLLALAIGVFRPAPYWESTLLHLLNFVLFLLALASFELFAARLLALADAFFSDGDTRPAWAWWILGYTAFAVCTLRIITLVNDTPDMALAALVFLASGVLCGIARQQQTAITYALLGAILGTAYLAKSVMLPLSIAYMAVVALGRGGLRKADPRVLTALAGFALIAAPFVLELSKAKGRLTFGDTGKVAYLHQVLGADERDAGSVARFSTGGVTNHVPRRIFGEPPLYLYVTPFSLATYPAWYDVGYWWEGRTPRFLWGRQIDAVGRASTAYFRMLSTEKQWVAGWLVLAIFVGNWKETLKRISRLWFLWACPLAALGLYSLVLAEPRYAAVWVTILWLALFAAVPWARLDGARNLGVAVVLAIALTTGIAIAKGGTENLARCFRPERHLQWQVAEQLRQMGFRPSEQIAFLGHKTVADYWARLTGLRVTADIPATAMESYWSASAETRGEIARRLRASGVGALVISEPPRNGESWQELPGTGYYVKILEVR